MPHKLFHYDGESRTSFVANAISVLAKISAVIAFFALWPGGPFEFVLDFVVKHSGGNDLGYFLGWFGIPVLVWLVVTMIGYSFRQFTAFMTGAIVPAFAVATSVTAGLFVKANPTVVKISETLGITHGQVLAAIWFFLFIGTMAAVAYFFRNRGYHYD
jgi:hypothetical protein